MDARRRAIVNELYEYKNLGVLKNYVNSFPSNVEDNIEKARKKAGMIFSSDFNRRKTKPLIYIKFWRQACLPSLLFGTELFTLNAGQLTKLERCQQWFLKNIFHVPNFAPNSLLLKLSGLKGISGRKKSLAQMKEREKCKKRVITDLNAPNGSRDIPFQSQEFG